MQLIPYVSFSDEVGASYPDVSINLASYEMISRKFFSDYGAIGDNGMHFDLKSADETREKMMPNSKISYLEFGGGVLLLRFRNGDARKFIEEKWKPK